MEVANELFIMSVSAPKMTGRESLMTRMPILSGPGDVLDGIERIIRWTSVQVTELKVRGSSSGGSADESIDKFVSMLSTDAICTAASADFRPTDGKNG